MVESTCSIRNQEVLGSKPIFALNCVFEQDTISSQKCWILHGLTKPLCKYPKWGEWGSIIPVISHGISFFFDIITKYTLYTTSDCKTIHCILLRWLILRINVFLSAK